MPTQTVLSAPSDSLLWAEVGDAVLFRSTDRGDRWAEANLPVPTHEIAFADASHGWLLGPASPATQCQSESVDLRATSDGGVTWQKMQPVGVASAQCKESLSFTDASHGFLGAWDDNSPPVIYRTADGGSTWRSSAPLADPPGWTSHPGGSELRTGPVHAFGTTLLAAVTNNAGQAYVYRSTDGGASWSYYRTLPAAGGYPGFATAEHWLMLTTPGLSQETTDGGATWHRSTSDYNQAAGVAPTITFADATVGYATVRGVIQRTIDGGQHWSTISTPGT